jgi:hypothetical protein
MLAHYTWIGWPPLIGEVGPLYLDSLAPLFGEAGPFTWKGWPLYLNRLASFTKTGEAPLPVQAGPSGRTGLLPIPGKASPLFFG